MLGPTLLIGAGVGLVMLPATMLATAGVETRQAGLASGLVHMSWQLGGAVGLSVLVTIAATVTSHRQRARPAAAVVHGYSAALIGLRRGQPAGTPNCPLPSAGGVTRSARPRSV